MKLFTLAVQLNLKPRSQQLARTIHTCRCVTKNDNMDQEAEITGASGCMVFTNKMKNKK